MRHLHVSHGVILKPGALVLNCKSVNEQGLVTTRNSLGCLVLKRQQQSRMKQINIEAP